MKCKIGRKPVGDHTVRHRLNSNKFADDTAVYSALREAFEQST